MDRCGGTISDRNCLSLPRIPSSLFAINVSLLLIYPVLSGQYESWISVLLALLGTVGALTALGLANNIYTQIGLVLLIALAAKNAIMVVEVAREERELHGKSILEATVLAARTRFRSILMTSFAFILGLLQQINERHKSKKPEAPSAS